MISIGSLMRLRMAAVLALLAFAWQGAVQGTAGSSLPTTVPGERQTVASVAELRPAHAILPMAPVEVAKPAPPEHRRVVALPPTVFSAASPREAPRGTGDTGFDRVPRPARLSPPYAARGPPLLS